MLDFLINELTSENIFVIYTANESAEEATFNKTMKLLLENTIIRKDLSELDTILQQIQRIDVIAKLGYYQNLFVDFTEEMFVFQMKMALETQNTETHNGKPN